ncbi:Glycosyltransferase [Heracleum sosnowskyi]|uniref:Glycosyltransferase n=1 Tax=Heracleum sosnowskyi TaxID=360622 RepID=A0AAD8GTY2_9APIA|nr:Glycosyltransferase [Heracleum sosnowskyi]
MGKDKVISPHVLLFPLPLQGPVNCMLKLAELLAINGLHVTFLNTDYIQNCLLKHTHVQSRFEDYPEFRFETIADGLSEDHPRTGDKFIDIVIGIEKVMKPNFVEMLTNGKLSSKSSSPVSFMIADGFYSFAVDLAKDVGIPLMYFETLSPCALWTFFCLPRLIELGEVPFKENDYDRKVSGVPETENFLRQRDLPSFFRIRDLNHPIIQFILKEIQEIPRSQGLLLNTSEHIDGPIISQISTLCPNIYNIGPLHALHKSILLSAQKASPHTNSSNSLWEDDKSCMTWLDAQPLKSVIYVSIGSLAVMTMDQLMELWHGIVNSGKRFLWALRPGSIAGKDNKYAIPAELSDATKERGCIVSWVFQEEVLAHPAIGLFFTHSGWNSTLESLIEGVPMICWPYIVDQQVNSCFVQEVWRVGIDMKDSCDRVTVEKTIREVMEDRKDEFEKSSSRMAKLAGLSIADQGGSSHHNFNRLVKDIRAMSSHT